MRSNPRLQLGAQSEADTWGGGEGTRAPGEKRMGISEHSAGMKRNADLGRSRWGGLGFAENPMFPGMGFPAECDGCWTGECRPDGTHDTTDTNLELLMMNGGGGREVWTLSQGTRHQAI